MKTSKSRTGFFSFPYVVWMILFVVVPLLIMAYYGFTDQNGNFTWSNILSMAEPIHRKALWTSVRLSVQRNWSLFRDSFTCAGVRSI